MRAIFVMLSLFVGSAAMAGPQCTDVPAASWLSATDMRARIAASDYKVDVFKTTKGNCYEIYGRNKEGKRVEVYFHPVTGEVIKESALR